MSIKVLGLCGSMKPNSSTAFLLHMCLDEARKAGAETTFYDLAEHPLPFCDARHDGSTYPEEVHEFRSLVQQAEGIIIATPDYHNSFTGSLKNAIDLCGFDEFDGKMVGIIGVAGGALGAPNAISHLRAVMRAVGAWVVPHQVSVSNSNKMFSGPNKLADEALEKRVIKLGRDVARFAKLHHQGLITAPE
jgi:NAD(P)H-dependent FMN reductase